MPELPAEVKELAARVRNWGRWGPDDELGTLNLIDAAALLRAAAEVRTGKRFALGIPLDEKGPQTGAVPGRINPLRTMLMINHPYLKGDRRNFCTVRFYGCPAEETLIGKVFMAQAGAYNDLDAAITWHPWVYNGVWGSRHLAMSIPSALPSPGGRLTPPRRPTSGLAPWTRSS